VLGRSSSKKLCYLAYKMCQLADALCLTYLHTLP
jgi:hypothetical protein